ncbi:helix-turn-helix domain-containing protein [Ichthyenterobacterium magnum]|uniref:AraC-like DNA-binding protein n=1 Tax=Ichthyenterobacterium magnum TaxID=1230530 RepID=A0A420DLP1_9FLAO|nr:AraC family transcriptional regulator [Ichthyenterobacterium magnum]RKE95105.1 AraC-like DNA-binding protein [Ichthyenterobacterium magnum]
MNIEFIDFFILIGIVQGLFFSLAILFSKFFKSNTNLYLGAALLIGVFINIQYCLLKYNWYEQHPSYRILEDIELVLLFPVCLFIYYQKFLNPKQKLSTKYLLLLLPFIISLIVNLYIGGHFYFKLYNITNTQWISSFYGVEYYASIILNLILLVVEYNILFRKKRANNYTINYDSKWIKIFYGFHVLVVATWVILEILDYYFYGDYTFILWLILNFFFYWVGYIGIYKFRLARNRYEIREVVNQEKQSPKSTKPKLSNINENPHFQKMIALLEEDKLYKDPKLSRNDIAEKIGISVGYFSQVINAVSKKSFSDYLNFYRVEDVKRMIINDEFKNYNILAIGLEAGFNSKSAFYIGFKKETGYTPSEYKKLHINN